MKNLTPEIAESIPSNEISRWTSRLNRVDFATQQNHSVIVGGWSDDGQTEYMLAKRALSDPDWREDPMYEEVILYEVKSGINFGRLADVFLPAEDYAGHDAVHTQERDVARIARIDGFKRIGLLVEDEKEEAGINAPVAALAALCVKRADINEPVDRKLFDRKPEIDMMVSGIEEATPVRYLVDKTADEDPYRCSVYYATSYATDGMLRKLGSTSRFGAWWDELGRDLDRIDEASDNL